jgi:hypothetical protein
MACDTEGSTAELDECGHGSTLEERQVALGHSRHSTEVLVEDKGWEKVEEDLQQRLQPLDCIELLSQVRDSFYPFCHDSFDVIKVRLPKISSSIGNSTISLTHKNSALIQH